MAKLTATNSVSIHAAKSRVWQALIDPNMIREYMFGTNAVSEWKKGSDITYTGGWEGKLHINEGKILAIEPEKKLHTTYLSDMSDEDNSAAHYANVIYELSEEGNETTLTISQDNIEDEAGVAQMNENWSKVLESMKQFLEK